MFQGIVYPNAQPAQQRSGSSPLSTRSQAARIRYNGRPGELASDAGIDNTVSHGMHTGLGFEETERVVYFRKDL